MKSRRRASSTQAAPRGRSRGTVALAPSSSDPRYLVPGHGSSLPIPEVHLSYALPRRGVPAAASFRGWVAAALVAARHPGAAELSIRIVDAREGRTLNHRYRGQDHATNVLSFGIELPAGVTSDWLGDLVIAAPVVAREARAQGKPLRDHYAHLTVHGVLHLLGYDHQQAGEARRMEALEIGALATLGIPDPYRDRTATSR